MSPWQVMGLLVLRAIKKDQKSSVGALYCEAGEHLCSPPSLCLPPRSPRGSFPRGGVPIGVNVAFRALELVNREQGTRNGE